MGQTIKGSGVGGSGVHSNLSKQPNRGEEGLIPPSLSSTNTSTLSPPTDLFGADISDVIFPSSVTENGGGNESGGGGLGSGKKSTELRVMRNIAASECGAKLLQASPTAKHAHAILVDNNDEYMNQPCASEKWCVLLHIFVCVWLMIHVECLFSWPSGELLFVYFLPFLLMPLKWYLFLHSGNY